jgi:hypothetical protein
MARDDEPKQIEQTRAALLDLLLSKVKDDTYPSATTLDLLEQLLTPEELPAYAGVLMEKIARDQYPSASLMKRLVSLTS